MNRCTKAYTLYEEAFGYTNAAYIEVLPNSVTIHYRESHVGKQYKFMFYHGQTLLNVILNGDNYEQILTPRGVVREWSLPDQSELKATYMMIDCFGQLPTKEANRKMNTCVLTNYVTDIAYQYVYPEELSHNNIYGNMDEAAYKAANVPWPHDNYISDPDMETEYTAPISYGILKP
jgi:hypothetical protein